MRSSKNTKFLAGALFCMACPARFERATYALEEIVAAQKSNCFNDLGRKIGSVQQTVQSVLFNKLQNKYRGASQS